jgi:cellulose biosynthesis protein BcsQ
MKSLTLFNNKGGVGKTTMTFNLAHMFARLGRTVAIIDCDPQCNLSALALSDDDLEESFEARPAEGRNRRGMRGVGSTRQGRSLSAPVARARA